MCEKKFCCLTNLKSPGFIHPPISPVSLTEARVSFIAKRWVRGLPFRAPHPKAYRQGAAKHYRLNITVRYLRENPMILVRFARSRLFNN